MRNIVTICLGACAALVACAALAQGAVQPKNNGMTCFNGYAYTLDDGDYRYTEHHEQKRRDGALTTWNVTYIGKNGKVIGQKHMDFTDNPTVPTYTMKLADGYREGITHENSQWTLFRRESAQAKKQTKHFKIDRPMAADAGFNPLVRKHFKQLVNGQSVAFKFAVAGRQSVISLESHKAGTTTFEHRRAVVFETQLDIPIIHWFVDSIKLTYAPDSERLLEYRGIGNMHNDEGKVYPVRVSYYTHMPAVAEKNGAPKAACGSVEGKSLSNKESAP